MRTLPVAATVLALELSFRSTAKTLPSWSVPGLSAFVVHFAVSLPRWLVPMADTSPNTTPPFATTEPLALTCALAALAPPLMQMSPRALTARVAVTEPSNLMSPLAASVPKVEPLLIWIDPVLQMVSTPVIVLPPVVRSPLTLIWYSVPAGFMTVMLPDRFRLWLKVMTAFNGAGSPLPGVEPPPVVTLPTS